MPKWATRFGLGGITIQIIAVKGHTPGMMCALIKEERIMIFGDACGVAVILAGRDAHIPIQLYGHDL